MNHAEQFPFGNIKCPHCGAEIWREDLATTKTLKMRDGEVVLYRREQSGKWQARFKTPSGDWHRISTKRSAIALAKKIACDAYDLARFRQQEGIAAVSRRFRDVARQSVSEMKSALDSKTGKVAFKDYIIATEKYLIPFFGAKHIDNIKQPDVEKFNAWRIEQMQKKPAASTLSNHNAALNRVFDKALSLGYVTQSQVPLIANGGRKSNRRPDFNLEDWRKVTANLRHWAKKGKIARSIEMRHLLWDYVLILANTGIRTGTEANNLKWKNLRWHKIANEKYLVIGVDGKTGKRELIARHDCDKFFARIQQRFDDLKTMSFDELLAAKIDVHVFRTAKGNQTTNLNQTFRQFLVDSNLLCDQHGQERTLYSLRHTYATLRLVTDKIPIHDLAKQMGTSIAMIERHYSYLAPIQIAEQLAGKRHENTKM